MNSLPTEDNPFPARKFCRCFAKVLELQDLDGNAEPSQINEAVSPAPVDAAVEEQATPVAA